MKRSLLLVICACAFLGHTTAAVASEARTFQTDVKIEQGEISITSRGRDVREILHDLILMSGKSYVVEPNVKGQLYLALRGVDFDEALEIICKQCSLDYKIKNDIYFFSQKSKPSGSPAVKSAPASNPTKGGRLDPAVLRKIVDTNFLRTDLRTVLDSLSKQTGLTIRAHESIPKYSIDLVLKKSSLGYGLKVISDAMKLNVVFTNAGTIELVPTGAKH